MASKRSSELAALVWTALHEHDVEYGHDVDAVAALDELVREVQRLNTAPLRDALVALWTDRRSDKHAELYAEAMLALANEQ